MRRIALVADDALFSCKIAKSEYVRKPSRFRQAFVTLAAGVCVIVFSRIPTFVRFLCRFHLRHPLTAYAQVSRLRAQSLTAARPLSNSSG
jgi:hypothetical protein